MRNDEARLGAEGRTRSWRRMAPAIAAGFFLAGCASSNTRIVGSYPGTGALQDWRAIANTNLPGRGEILKIVDLGRSDALSNHLAIVQSRELPHRHKFHDATVTILRGQGTMTIGQETRRVGAGAVVFIPRGVVHHFDNESDPPTVALVVYAPPFDGSDREIVTGTGTETSPEESPSADGSPAPPPEQSEVSSPEPGQDATLDGAASPDAGVPPEAPVPTDPASSVFDAPAGETVSPPLDAPTEGTVSPPQDAPPMDAPPDTPPPDAPPAPAVPADPTSPFLDAPPAPAPDPSPGAVIEGTQPEAPPPAP